MSDAVRFPAEWEPQSAILIAWPHAGTDWAERLDEVEAAYVGLVAAITRFEDVVACVPDAAIEAHARTRLADGGVDPARLRFVQADYDDTWLRDSGPITLRRGDGFELLDFRFTGWGGKFAAARDDRLVRHLRESGIFLQNTLQSIDFSLEGGAIETDGDGTLLTTWRCLHERHPELDRAGIERILRDALHQHRVLWLDHGYLEGDDTDAHVDTLARFAGTDTIVYQACDDPADPHHRELQAMAAELAALRTREGRPYRLHPLPWPRPVTEHGRRLAASYANFLVVNGGVLVPAYGDPADAAAAAVLENAFPGRAVVPVPCRTLIWQNGSLHCLTMQLPQGLV